MAEEDIIKILKNCKSEALSVTEIADKLIGKANRQTIAKAIRQLKKFGEIEAIQVDVRVARKIYGKNLKKGLQLFYVVEE